MSAQTPLSSQRRLLVLGTLAGVAATKLAHAAAASSSVDFDKSIVVNTLGGLENPNVPPTEAELKFQVIVRMSAHSIDEQAIRDLHASGTTAVNITVGYVSGPADAFEYTVSDIGHWVSWLRDHPADFVQVFKARDIVQAKAQKKIGLIFGFQNAVMLGDNPERVDLFADLGVRIFQLTYNPSNQIGDGSTATGNRGLTPVGRAMVERMNERRVLVDLAHSGQNTCLDAARASKAPIAITHTGCRALSDLPRNKSDEELRLVAEKGGYVGIYFMPFLRRKGHAMAADVVAHIEHAIKVCGEDHVGIGTDGGVTPQRDLAELRKQQEAYVALRKAQGVAAPGESADDFFFVKDLNGVDQFRKLAGLLEQRGHPGSRIEKILGGNFVRVARDVWGA